MPLAPHPYGRTTTDHPLPARAELLRRLSIRLEYASFKLSHSLTLHTLSELENLYLRPFHTQALRREKVRKEREEGTRKRWRVEAREADQEREGRRERGECVDVIGPMEVEAPEAEFEGWSEKKLGKRRAVERDEQPRRAERLPKKQVKRQRKESTASTGEERPQFAPATAKVDSRIRLPQPTASSSRSAFAATHAEYAQQHDGRPYTPYDVSTLGKTTSELLSPHTGLSPSHSDSIPSLQGTTSSTSSFFAMALQQPHPPEHEHAASPFSARSTAASYGTTLAPASSSTSLHSAAATVSPLLEHAASPSSALAPPHPGPDHSSQPSPYPSPLPPRTLAAPTASSSSSQQFTSASALLSTPHPPALTPAPSSSSKRSPLMLGSQASFSALPPVPPLPFDGPPLVGMGMGLSQGSQGWRAVGAGGGVGSSSPDQARRLGRDREKVRWEEREEGGATAGLGSGSGFLPARLPLPQAQEPGDGEGSDDELPPADSADDSADLEQDEGAGEDGFDPLSQDTVVHESQSQSQQRDGDWSEEETDGTRERWKVG